MLKLATQKTAEKTFRTEPPYLLRHGTLRDYQRAGLDWLVALHSSGLNGILADEMGLGKTVQTIALFAHLAAVESNWGPHLLVVPTSVVMNWTAELHRWLPGFKAVAYLGTASERKLLRRGWDTCNAVHAIVMSYSTAVADAKFLRRRKWEYLVLDEAHHIKNYRSQKWQTLLVFRAEHRLLLTGTPLQNDVMELWAFLHFLMPAAFASRLEFAEWFDVPMAELARRNRALAHSPVVRALHAVLRPFMLRRLKSEVAAQLPRKVEVLVECSLSSRQRKLYEDFVKLPSTCDLFARKSLAGLWGVLMQLRKVCNHPDLFEGQKVLSPLELGGFTVTMPKGCVLEVEKVPITEVFSALKVVLREDEIPSDESVAKVFDKALMDGESSKLLCEKVKNPIWEMAEKEEKMFSDKKTENYKWKRVADNRRKCLEKPVLYGESLLRWLYLATVQNKQKNGTKNSPEDRAIKMAAEIENFLCVTRKVRASPATLSGPLKTDLQVGSEFGLSMSKTVSTSERLPPAKRKLRSDDKNHKMAGSPPGPLFKNGMNDIKKLVADGDVTAKDGLAALTEPFQNIIKRSSMFFPDRRLIQWDCGKLQVKIAFKKNQRNWRKCSKNINAKGTAF